MNHAIVINFELIPARTMKWKCIACRCVFDGPTNRVPRDGCPSCGSRVVIDCNVSLVSNPAPPNHPTALD